jgi:hypothetical protein
MSLDSSTGLRQPVFQKMLDDPMTKEAWSLAATLLSQDGLNSPALLLWRDADDAVKLCRVETSSSKGDMAQDIVAASHQFVFDHAVLISRTVLCLSNGSDSTEIASPPFSRPRHGVALTFVSKAGARFMYFSQIVEEEGCFHLSQPTVLPPVPTPLDLLFKPSAPLH